MKTNLIINSKSKLGKKKAKTLTGINTNASNELLDSFTQKLTALSNDELIKAKRVMTSSTCFSRFFFLYIKIHLPSLFYLKGAFCLQSETPAFRRGVYDTFKKINSVL